MPIKGQSPKQIAHDIPDEELAYIAGFFDGEGCVNFARTRKSQFIRVLIVNTNREVLEFIQERFGGDIYANKRHKEDWKRSYTWRASWTRAIDFLNAIGPWVRVKRDQMNLAFCWDYCRLEKDKSANEYMIECLKFFNKKGVHNLEDPIQRELDAVERQNDASY